MTDTPGEMEQALRLYGIHGRPAMNLKGCHRLAAGLAFTSEDECDCGLFAAIENARQQDAKVAEVTAELDNWKEDAKVRAQNTEFWRQKAEAQDAKVARLVAALKGVWDYVGFDADDEGMRELVRGAGATRAKGEKWLLLVEQIRAALREVEAE